MQPDQSITVGLIADLISIIPVSLWKNTVRPKLEPVCSAIMGILYEFSTVLTACTFLSPMLKTSELVANICAPPAILAFRREVLAPLLHIFCKSAVIPVSAYL